MAIIRVERKAVQICYLRRSGAYGPAIAGFWTGSVNPWLSRHGWVGRVQYALIQDDPQQTPPALCRYDVGVEVSADSPAAAGEPTQWIPGGRYASVSFRGTAQEVGEAWRYLMTAATGRDGKAAPRPYLEVYPTPGDYDPATGAFRCDLMVPLAEG